MNVDTIFDLPTTIPLMPLHCGILLPRAELQMPVTEVGNLSVISSALQSGRYIGVVQARGTSDGDLFHSGCVGQVLDVQDNDEEERLILAIRGICRFDIREELPIEQNCRKAVVTYEKYAADIVQEADFPLDRYRLITALKKYCEKLHITPNWKEISNISNERLITMLMMICPFHSEEKQTLLETASYTEQSRLITSMIEMDSFSSDSVSPSYH